MNPIETLHLTDCEVDISTAPVTWGQREVIKLYVMRAYKDKDFIPEELVKASVKRAEYAIKEIRKGGVIMKYSFDWFFALPPEDVSKINKILDEVDAKKKELVETKS